MMDLDMALREDEPHKPTNESTEAMRAHYAKWERSNRLSLISIKRSIVEHLIGGIPESNNAKEFLVAVANRYQTSDNAEAEHFMDELMNMRYDDMKGVPKSRLHTTPESVWGVNDLITKCVAEEEKLKREKNESAHLVALGKPNNQKRVEKTRKPNFHSHKKNKNFKKSGSEKQKNGNAKNTYLKCYHCNKKDSWWLDSGATIHVATSLQGIRNMRKPSEKESKLKVGSDIGIDVEHIGVAVLELDSGNCVLSDGLYRLSLLSTCSYNVENNVTKRPLTKERSSLLWHKRLGHISKERVERLISSGILPRLDSDDLEICVDCMKGKLTKNKKKGATRSQNLLEIVHTDISGPYSTTLCGNKYFITFIDDFSRYGYVFFIKEKADALEMFKVFRTEVEKQLGKVIKIMRSDRGGEYYGKHGDVGQQKGPFARYLQDNGIVAQYTMPGSPEQNGVAERRNHTLMEMKRSMMGRSNFPEYLWDRKPNLNHFKVWGCPVEVKIYDPSLKKTDSRTTRCYFIGYPSHSKGYKFYCSTRGTRIVESQVAKFLKFDVADSIPSQFDERVEPMDVISLRLPVSDVNLDVGAFDSGIQQGVATVNFPIVEINPIVDEIPPVEMRRSQRTRRPALSNDYYVYLGEEEYDNGK
ncbi:Retrovirus-related Pol polyprotein from transposon TNT 1-94 [Vitis vinifera]|uniref:Retrovirus-related Pol polyprotein from transposon TNT 1-94 n=1 Tax=Vitis vinifera TaxID=29760 RepID=A0A438CKA6_VITVI|nr:Retrovirus-related Pol polyprotein from transposon TNT 1-94 [Vitis vinifera]